VPLAERDDVAPRVTPEPDLPPPDNRAGWEAIAKTWQEQRYGDSFGTALMWSWRASEEHLHVLDEADVRGKRVIVLGCGGGQDVVALEKLGAVATGVDVSAAQIAYARKFAARHDATNASFVEGAIEDLSRFDDASFDLAVSIGVMEYIQHLDDALAEAARVLRPGGVFALSVRHPFDVIVEPGAPLVIRTSYWSTHHDRIRPVRTDDAPRFRSHMRTMQRWFDGLTSAGFAVERLIEPKEDELPRVNDRLHDDWLELLPYMLVIKARKR
jgi:SAM-dependent methyltransferase